MTPTINPAVTPDSMGLMVWRSLWRRPQARVCLLLVLM
jgi:hypothetical protein